MKIQEVLKLTKDYNNLLKEKLTLKVKVEIQKWINEHNYIIEDLRKQRSDMIKSISSNGSIAVKLEDGTINPDYVEFDQKFEKILLSEIDTLELAKFDFKDIENVETERNYSIVYNYHK